jgi:formate dehydrogenase major subunit
MYPRSMEDSDCVVVMGSNMAENHPVAFRWPMKAKVEHGAKIIHVDPRFTRTSAVADIYAPVRAGSDIAFLGGVINYVTNSERWNNDPFFKSWVVNSAEVALDDLEDTARMLQCQISPGWRLEQRADEAVERRPAECFQIGGRGP